MKEKEEIKRNGDPFFLGNFILHSIGAAVLVCCLSFLNPAEEVLKTIGYSHIPALLLCFYNAFFNEDAKKVSVEKRIGYLAIQGVAMAAIFL